MPRWLVFLLPTVGLLVGLILYRFLFWTLVDEHHFAYKHDNRDGSIEYLERSGYHRVMPFITQIHRIDLRPMQFCLEESGIILNCKTVQFDPEGFDVFLDVHGRHIHTTFVHDFREYVFDARSDVYPFIKVLNDLVPKESML